MRKVFQGLIYIAIIVSSCKDSKNQKLIENEHLTDHNSNWELLMIEGYQKFNSDRSNEAAELILEATELMPNKNLENYLVSAMIFAQNSQQEKVLIAIEKAIKEGFKDPQLLNSIPEFIQLREHVTWNKLITQAKNLQEKDEASVQNPLLLKELKEMWANDQEVLAQYEKNINTLDSTATYNDHLRLFKPVERIWKVNKIKLDSIIKIHGWPGNKLVGEAGAKVAWGIPQHHPNIFFKRKCLLLIKKALEKGDVDPNHYAKLHDRIARETWQKQIYGTSIAEHAPFPIKDPKNINKRRAELGLFEPFEVYAIYHGLNYQPPSSKEIQTIYEKAQNDYLKFEESIRLNQVDSVNIYISKAISAYGDINNEQLYNAAISLAKLDNQSSQLRSMKILKVLIWREWENRFKILSQNEFKALKDYDEWKEIQNLIETSE